MLTRSFVRPRAQSPFFQTFVIVMSSSPQIKVPPSLTFCSRKFCALPWTLSSLRMCLLGPMTILPEYAHTIVFLVRIAEPIMAVWSSLLLPFPDRTSRVAHLLTPASHLDNSHLLFVCSRDIFAPTANHIVHVPHCPRTAVKSLSGL